MIRKSIEEISEILGCSFIGNSSLICDGVSIDSRKTEENNLFIPIKGENSDGHAYAHSAIKNGAKILLWNENIAIPKDLDEKSGLILVKDTTIALQKLAIAYRHELKAKFIGITGSNGKTSTKDILAGILSAKFKTQKTLGNNNNELGVPMTILSLDEDTEMAVIEMGIDNIGDLPFLKDMVKPDIGILTNVGVAHLYHFNSVQEIAYAKLEMVQCVNENGYFIYNDDNYYISEEMEKSNPRKDIEYISFGKNNSSDIYFTDLVTDEKGVRFNAHGFIDLPVVVNLLGKHQSYNSLPAIAAAKLCGLKDEEILRGLTLIEPTGLRNELIKLGNRIILNDIYKSNPESVYAAMDTFEEISSPYKIVVLGDMLGLGKTEKEIHRTLGVNLSKYKIDECIFYGDFAADMKEGALTFMPEDKITVVSKKSEITEKLLNYENCSIVLKASRDLALDEVVNELKEKLEK